MVGWTVKFTTQAVKDAGSLKRIRLDERAKGIIAIMEEDPFGKPPPFEKLKGDLKGKYSRRINGQHRLVYSIDSKSRTVIVFAMYSHYES